MVEMTTQSAVVDVVFRALADPTRRRVLERLSRGPATVTELAAPFEMKLPSFVQHMAVLEESQLVRSVKTGRSRVYRIAPRRLRTAESWFDQQRRMWERRLDQFDAYVTQLHEQEKLK